MNLDSTALRKVLPLLALRPGEPHTLTDIMGFSGLDSKSVWRVLDQMRADGALLDGTYGPKTYSINPAYEHYQEIKVIAFRLLGLPAGMEGAGVRTDLIVLFGSLLRPVFRRESDIDLLLVGRDEEEARTAVDALSQRLGKHVGVTFYSPAKFVSEWEAHEPFLTAVFSGPHAILAGSFDNLGVGGGAL
jgi:hypothetical protein